MPEDHRIIGPNSLSLLKVLILKVQLAFTNYETYHFILKKNPEESRMQLGALCPTLQPNKSQNGR